MSRRAVIRVRIISHNHRQAIVAGEIETLVCGQCESLFERMRAEDASRFSARLPIEVVLTRRTFCRRL
jgi:hypothetical protein